MVKKKLKLIGDVVSYVRVKNVENQVHFNHLLMLSFVFAIITNPYIYSENTRRSSCIVFFTSIS